MSWTCYECESRDAASTHPEEWKTCPYSGVSRKEASTPTPDGIPRCWTDNPSAWHKFKDELDRLDGEELRLAGLRRVGSVTEEEIDKLDRWSAELGEEMKEMREENEMKSEDKKNEDTYFFLRQRETSKPIGVVALRKDERNEGCLRIAVSLCAPSDPWDKVAGVNKALGRLNSPTHSLLTSATDHLVQDLLSELMPPAFLGGYDPATRHDVDLDHAQAMLRKQMRFILKPRP